MKPAALLAAAVFFASTAAAARPSSGDRIAPVVIDSGACRFVLEPKNAPLAGELAPVCSRAVEALFGQLGARASSEAPIEVRIARTPDGMRDLAILGAMPPKWSDALAYPARSIILLSLTRRDGRPVEDLATVFEHELSHVALHRASLDARMPRWFSEGVAIQQSEGTSINRDALVAWAALGDRLVPLDALEEYPAKTGEIGLAYAQAADFVGFLLRDGGWEAVRGLLARLRAGAPFEDAFSRTYGVSVAKMERRWLEELREDWSWVTLATSSGALWGVITALFVVAWIAVRRRRRKRLDQMAAQEEPLERLIEVIAAMEKAEPSEATRATVEVDGETHTLH